MKVAVVGLGNMGGRIAMRLIQSGYDVTVFDANKTVQQKYAEQGAKISDDLAILAAQCDVIFTVLPNAQIVKAVVLGQDNHPGLIGGLRPESIVVDMTTSVPEITHTLSDLLAEQGVHMLDAPVTGGVSKAESGELTIMVGGQAQILERVKAPLMDLAQTIIHVGGTGAGHTAKALNNLITATTLTITAEAMAIGVRMGLDAGKLLDVINNGSGRSAASEQKFPAQILSGKFERGFTVALMTKDLGIALGMGQVNGIPAPVSAAVNELWKASVCAGLGEEDHTAIAQYVENMADVKLRYV
ncbi:NAD(P)-dependent oxidoreductase [Orrella sp. 11846]|uniref:NAD(P)-dependent oxidoreductase n=1 Tax=Orrella sp. 11846 TaxID=3409913 RepID=UPI003B5C6040